MGNKSEKDDYRKFGNPVSNSQGLPPASFHLFQMIAHSGACSTGKNSVFLSSMSP